MGSREVLALQTQIRESSIWNLIWDLDVQQVVIVQWIIFPFQCCSWDWTGLVCDWPVAWEAEVMALKKGCESSLLMWFCSCLLLNFSLAHDLEQQSQALVVFVLHHYCVEWIKLWLLSISLYSNENNLKNCCSSYSITLSLCHQWQMMWNTLTLAYSHHLRNTGVR